MARSFASIASASLRTADGKADSRRKLIGAVRAAAKRRGIDDDDRKAIQLEVTGKASMADMDGAEIGKVLDRLNRDAGGRALGAWQARPHQAKVRALWWTLYWLGEVPEPNERALDAFVLRQAGVFSLRFLDNRASLSVIEALKAIAARAGVRWPEVARLKADGNPTDAAAMRRYEREAVLRAIWQKLIDRGIVRAYADWRDYAGAAFKRMPNLAWSNRELDDVIRLIGKKLRTAIAKDAAGD